jgi:hypothetical protein
MIDSTGLIGRAPDDLSLPEREALTGRWIALQLYSPSTLPLKRIESVGDNPAACVAELQRRGLDPFSFEFVLYRGGSV